MPAARAPHPGRRARPRPAGDARARRPRPRPGLMVLLGVLASLLLAAGPAYAAIYQYWGYWQLTNGAWTFAQTGPAQTTPADGAVEGWRWAVDDGSGTRTPRLTPTFQQICGTTTTAPGTKRVGVVLDFGRPADAVGTPPAPPVVTRCASVPMAATGSEVLAAVAAVRVEKALVCGIDTYPASGCGGEVATLTDAQRAPDTPVTLTPTPTPTASSPASAATSEATPAWRQPAVLVAGAAAVLALLVLALRRRPRGS